MSVVIACAHIFGAIFAWFIFGFFVLFLQKVEVQKIQKQAIEEASIKLGLSEDDLNKDENAQKIIKLSSDKFSTELFKNRLSDFCGQIRLIFEWLVSISQILVLGFVLWHTFTDDLETAVYAWFLVVMSVISLIITFVFSLLCKLLTNRYPGQAKSGRKSTAEWVKSHQ